MIGSTSLKIKAYRIYFNGKWEEWRQPGGVGGLSLRLTTEMYLKAGKWYFGLPKYQPNEPDWKAVDCSNLPK